MFERFSQEYGTMLPNSGGSWVKYEDAKANITAERVFTERWKERTLKLCELALQATYPDARSLFALHDMKELIKEIKNEYQLCEAKHLIAYLAHGYELKKPIIVTVKKSDYYIATFVDANISTGDDTEDEAIFNLKSLIVDSFNSLADIPNEQLGPAMINRKKVLTECIFKV